LRAILKRMWWRIPMDEDTRFTLRHPGVICRARFLKSRVAGPASRFTGKQILHCFGDSHVAVFREVAHLRALRRTWLHVLPVRGATALGLANPNSKTNSLQLFREVIDTLPPDRPLLFMLGEVDCGFLIWYRAQHKGLSVDGEFDTSFRNYVGFLEALLQEGRMRLVIATVPPPTIRDGQQGAVANARREVSASLHDRTALTRAYNARLRTWATAHQCHFLDYEGELIDPVTGKVKEELRHADEADHHLDVHKHAQIVAVHLRAAGYL
jgi:hypothetical protein